MEAYPLSWPVGWPRTKYPERSRFGDWNSKPSVHKAATKLTEEIRMLGGADLIISTNLKLRLDGLPYSSQKQPDDRGVSIYFKWNKEAMVIACDSYDFIGCNLWAISKTIEAMRGIDRWGCSELLNRAFTGFKALPENGTADVAWWDVLGVDSHATFEEAKTAYREKAKELHPDNPDTGDDLKFRQLKGAYDQALLIYQN